MLAVRRWSRRSFYTTTRLSRTALQLTRLSNPWPSRRRGLCLVVPTEQHQHKHHQYQQQHGYDNEKQRHYEQQQPYEHQIELHSVNMLRLERGQTPASVEALKSFLETNSDGLHSSSPAMSAALYLANEIESLSHSMTIDGVISAGRVLAMAPSDFSPSTFHALLARAKVLWSTLIQYTDWDGEEQLIADAVMVFRASKEGEELMHTAMMACIERPEYWSLTTMARLLELSPPHMARDLSRKLINILPHRSYECSSSDLACMARGMSAAFVWDNEFYYNLTKITLLRITDFTSTDLADILLSIARFSEIRGKASVEKYIPLAKQLFKTAAQQCMALYIDSSTAERIIRAFAISDLCPITKDWVRACNFVTMSPNNLTTCMYYMSTGGVNPDDVLPCLTEALGTVSRMNSTELAKFSSALSYIVAPRRGRQTCREVVDVIFSEIVYSALLMLASPNRCSLFICKMVSALNRASVSQLLIYRFYEPAASTLLRLRVASFEERSSLLWTYGINRMYVPALANHIISTSDTLSRAKEGHLSLLICGATACGVAPSSPLFGPAAEYADTIVGGIHASNVSLLLWSIVDVPQWRNYIQVLFKLAVNWTSPNALLSLQQIVQVAIITGRQPPIHIVRWLKQLHASKKFRTESSETDRLRSSLHEAGIRVTDDSVLLCDGAAFADIFVERSKIAIVILTSRDTFVNDQEKPLPLIQRGFELARSAGYHVIVLEENFNEADVIYEVRRVAQSHMSRKFSHDRR